MSRILISLILLMTIGFGGCKIPIPKIIEADGGVKKYNNGANAPKIIESTEIISFDCEFSLIAAVLEEESELDGRVYALNAYLEDETVKCKIKWYDRLSGGEEYEFIADKSFMTKLHEIVVKYKFAKLNGYSSEVSGLPYMYGAKLDIRYESGESIYAYDNQDCFITFEAIEELVKLFSTAK